jgi:hypothetical protein
MPNEATNSERLEERHDPEFIRAAANSEAKNPERLEERRDPEFIRDPTKSV